MHIIQDEAARLSRLVHDLLDLAQLEGDSYPLTMEPIVFAQLIHDVLDQMAFIANQKGIYLKRTLDEDCIVYGDSDRLQQVVRNLLDNAIHYTPSGKSVSIELLVHQHKAELRVTDEGNGIPKEDLPHVSERFYRVNKARTRKDGGSGLGLAIVYQIMKNIMARSIFNLSQDTVRQPSSSCQILQSMKTCIRYNQLDFVGKVIRFIQIYASVA